jgi:predicted nucleotidyltransferase
MKSPKKIEEILKEHKKDLAEKYKVKEIGLFGSYVRGEQRKRSDVDILVEFQKIPDLFKFIELEMYLERILKKKVDLVEKNGLRPRLKDIILNEVVYV